jgi:hypothetical protein
LDDLPFFHPDSVDALVKAGVDLGLIYHCDPFRFLSMPEDALAELYRVTIERARDMRSPSSED